MEVQGGAGRQREAEGGRGRQREVQGGRGRQREAEGGRGRWRCVSQSEKMVPSVRCQGARFQIFQVCLVLLVRYLCKSEEHVCKVKLKLY